MHDISSISAEDVFILLQHLLCTTRNNGDNVHPGYLSLYFYNCLHVNVSAKHVCGLSQKMHLACNVVILNIKALPVWTQF